MPPDLITTTDLLDAWPQASALSTQAQSGLCDAASRRFELEADRIFGAQAYYETHRPGRTRTLYLRQTPVTAISRIAADFQTVGTIASTDPTAYEATVGYSGPATPEVPLGFTGITLNSVVNGVPATPVVLPFATYPTLQSLVAAVNARAGWSATVAPGGPTTGVGSFATMPSLYLAGDCGQQGCSILAFELKAYTRSLAYACDPGMARRGVVELLEGQGDGYRYPDRRYGGWGAGLMAMSGMAGGLDPRVGGVEVRYAAGYSPADMPGDIKRAAVGIARLMHEAVRVSGVYQSETFKDYSYSLAAALDLPPWIRAIAYDHGRKEIA